LNLLLFAIFNAGASQFVYNNGFTISGSA